MKKYLLITLIALSASLWAGNSIFSYQGFPVQYYGRDIYSLGMGDTGSSDTFRYNTGYANPALHHRENKTIFGTGMIFGFTGYSSQYKNSSGQILENTYRDDNSTCLISVFLFLQKEPHGLSDQHLCFRLGQESV